MMLTVDENGKIKELRQQGLSLRKIAGQVGRDVKTLRKHLAEGRKQDPIPTGDAEMVSMVFAKLNAGFPAEKIVEEDCIPPDTMIALHKKWQEVRGLGAVQWKDLILKLNADVEEIKRKLDALPILNLVKDYGCSCGDKRCMCVRVRCMRCGDEDWFGIQP